MWMARVIVGWMSRSRVTEAVNLHSGANNDNWSMSCRAPRPRSSVAAAPPNNSTADSAIWAFFTAVTVFVTPTSPPHTCCWHTDTQTRLRSTLQQQFVCLLFYPLEWLRTNILMGNLFLCDERIWSYDHLHLPYPNQYNVASVSGYCYFQCLEILSYWK